MLVTDSADPGGPASAVTFQLHLHKDGSPLVHRGPDPLDVRPGGRVSAPPHRARPRTLPCHSVLNVPVQVAHLIVMPAPTAGGAAVLRPAHDRQACRDLRLALPGQRSRRARGRMGRRAHAAVRQPAQAAAVAGDRLVAGDARSCRTGSAFASPSSATARSSSSSSTTATEQRGTTGPPGALTHAWTRCAPARGSARRSCAPDAGSAPSS